MTQSDFGSWGIIDWVEDRASDAADAVGDLATSVWDRIPGSGVLGDGVKALVTGPLKKFANTGVGEFLLNAMAASVGNAGHVAGLASFMPIIGPAILISSAAIPGIAQGKSFSESLAQGWAWRLQTAAQIAGPQVAAKFGELVGEAGKKLTEQAKNLFPDVDPQVAIDKLASMGIDGQKAIDKGITELQAQGIPTTEADAVKWAMGESAKLGVRADALLQAVDLNSGTSYFNLESWDISNGTYKKPLPQVTGPAIKSFGSKAGVVLSSAPKTITSFGKKTMPTPCEEYAAMQKTVNPNKAVLAALKSRCEASKFKGVIKPPLASAAASPLASTASTIAAKAAISAAAAAPPEDSGGSTVAPPILQTAQKTSDSRSTKLGIIAGIAGTAVGAGGSLLAGLSYAVAAPVAIGFGVGAGVGTKLLTRKK